MLIATGIIGLPSHEHNFGYEAAGIVRCVGSDVKKVAVGDRVALMAINTLATVVTTTEQLCEKLPDEMSFVDGASMPIVYSTAIYSLIDIAHLKKGQVRRAFLI